MPADRLAASTAARAAEAATLDWSRPWELLCDEQPGPDARWFVGAELEVAPDGVAQPPEKVSRELTSHVQDTLGGLARPRGVVLLDASG